ncbi:MAG TPA: ABC transporter permease subunit [Actinospica sp.]|nr:ABC transporter permease subunit [Actinospica sp.]
MNHVLRTGWRVLSPLLVSAIVGLLLWYAVVDLFSFSPYVVKSPSDVWTYLFSGPDAATNRSSVLQPLGTTLGDGAYGFFFGMLAALLAAITFVTAPAVESTFMPLATLLRSVPLVTMTPLIVLVFGRGVGGVAVIGGIVVFFPALVTIVHGLRSAPALAVDVVAVYGGGPRRVLTKVALPGALPYLFAAARLSVPSALVGALVTEWLATGQGIGGAILSDIGAFGYLHLWASIIVLTSVSVVLYTVLGAIEAFALSRMGMADR